MAAKMGRKTMLAKVATAAAEGIDPRDLAKLKTKVSFYNLYFTKSATFSKFYAIFFQPCLSYHNM